MNKTKNNAIQGLRFWAISLIIASHCGLLMQGGLGNTIFFAMSGFFVCRPYSTDDYEYKYFNIKSFASYYKKRVVRIIPACWLCMLFAAFGLRFFDFRDFSTEHSLLLNMFFIKSKNHLWFLQQEIVFYAFAPFLLLLLGLIKKLLALFVKKAIYINLILFAFLNLAVYITYKYSIYTGLQLYANGGPQLFKIWFFLIGMSFAYLLKAIKDIHIQNDSLTKLLRALGTAFVFICLVLSILSSEQILSQINSKYTGLYVGWTYAIFITYVASAVLVVISLLSSDSICCRFLGNKLFTVIGNASFSMYLIHGCLLSYFDKLSAYSSFITIYGITLAIAMAVYTYVEQPLMKLSAKENK